MPEVLLTSPQGFQESIPAEPRHSGGGKAPAMPAFHVETAATRDEMEEHRAAWELLAQNAVEPNVWYEPWMLLPAVEAFGSGVQFRFAFIYRTARSPNAQRELCGVFPLEVARHSRWAPCSVLRMWRHMLCFLGAPLIHQNYLVGVWNALLDWSSQSESWWLDLSHQPAEGPLWHSLLDVARERDQPVYPVESFHRAWLVRGESFGSYCNSAMSAHCRQELRRKRRRLSELGRLELRSLSENDALDDWTEYFLELESGGWKGREQSALTFNPAERTFFEELVCGAFARQRLHLMGLFLDGQPLAMKCNLLATPGSFSFKIAFDESLAKYSPGVLLEWDNTQWLLEQSDIEWMDSCAKPGHFMIGQLWKQRRQLHRLLIPTSRRGDLALSLRPFVHALKRSWRTP